MDKATISGLLLGLGILIAVVLLGHVPLHILFKPEALLIVFGGTFTTVLISFSPRELADAGHNLKRCFLHEDYSTVGCIHYITDVANFVRSEGILALQPLIPDVDIPFVRKGLQLIVDNRTEQFVQDSLSTDIEVSYRDDMDHARVFESAGGYAPTMGIIGAVIGLIQVSGTFQNPELLASGVAGAFVATLYGVALSNLFLLPLAGKLRQRARDAWFKKTLLLEGIMSIRSGDHPMITEEKLRGFLSNVSSSSTQPLVTNSRHYASHPNPQRSASNRVASQYSDEYQNALDSFQTPVESL